MEVITPPGGRNSREEGLSDATTPVFLPYQDDNTIRLKMVYLDRFSPYYVKSGEQAGGWPEPHRQMVTYVTKQFPGGAKSTVFNSFY